MKTFCLWHFSEEAKLGKNCLTNRKGHYAPIKPWTKLKIEKDTYNQTMSPGFDALASYCFLAKLMASPLIII